MRPSFDCCKLCILCLAAWQMLQGSSLLGQETASREGRWRVGEILADYTANRSKFSRYAVAANAKRSKVYKEAPTKTHAADHWYLASFDGGAMRRRFDMILRKTSSESGLTSTSPIQTLVIDRGKLGSWYGDQLLQKADLESLSQEERANWQMQGRIVRYDPWNLPFTASSDLSTQSSLVSNDGKYEERLTRTYKLIELREELAKVTAVFWLNEKIDLGIRFRKHDDILLPVECSFYRKYEGNDKREVINVRTSWGKVKGQGWAPVKLEVASIQGNPSKPTIFNDFEVEFYWVFGDSFPEEVFTGREVSPLSLRERIVENAASLVPLRTGL